MPDPDDEEGVSKHVHFKKKEGAKFFECERAESPVWKELKHSKVIDGKPTRTNELTGKDKRYYQWDDCHKEVEMYDQHGNPIDALDPVTGEMKGKDVAHHQKLNVR